MGERINLFLKQCSVFDILSNWIVIPLFIFSNIFIFIKVIVGPGTEEHGTMHTYTHTLIHKNWQSNTNPHSCMFLNSGKKLENSRGDLQNTARTWKSPQTVNWTQDRAHNPLPGNATHCAIMPYPRHPTPPHPEWMNKQTKETNKLKCWIKRGKHQGSNQFLPSSGESSEQKQS